MTKPTKLIFADYRGMIPYAEYGAELESFLCGKSQTDMRTLLIRFGFQEGEATREDQMRLAALLKERDWRRKRVREGFSLKWVYVRSQ